MVRNMTEGSPMKLIVAFTIPLLIGNLFQQFYNIADIIIVGRFIGVHALAAVGATAPLFMGLLALTIGLASGFTVITAQRFGGHAVGCYYAYSHDCFGASHAENFTAHEYFRRTV